MGNRVGERARQEFRGATLIDLDYRKPHRAVEATRRAIDEGAPVILEASFFEDNIFVAVDVLSKEPNGWVVTEVKATKSVKEQHYADAAVQTHVVERAGLPVTRVELMHLNGDHRHPDEGPLFTRAVSSNEVAALRVGSPAQAAAQGRMLEGPLPDVEPGPHCTTPYDCPFLARCHAPAPDHAIDELNGIRAPALGELREKGVETIEKIPSDFPLKPLHARHRAAVLQKEIIDEPGLERALAAYRHPIAMLDFETVGPALPVWNGCSPLTAIPVQFSVHTLHENGEVTHSAHLAEGKGDPRPALAQAVVESRDGAATILAWHASVEKRCLKQLAEAAPEHATALLEAHDKTEDLLLVVKNHVYHPAFRGSFSIKHVAPALLPEMAYDDLDVADGMAASHLLESVLCRTDELAVQQCEDLRAQLRAYCKHDTAVMVSLFRFLREVADRRDESSFTGPSTT